MQNTSTVPVTFEIIESTTFTSFIPLKASIVLISLSQHTASTVNNLQISEDNLNMHQRSRMRLHCKL